MRRSGLHAAAWALLILVLTLMPPPEVPGHGWLGRYHADKLVHAILFGVQVVLLARAMAPWKNTLPWALLMAIAYSALTELLQGLMVTGREADPWDLLADAAGAILAAVWWHRGMAKATH